MENRGERDGAAHSSPIPAATVVLARGEGLRREVLLLRRPSESVFAPDHWVFPGGRLDPEDYAFDHRGLTDGPTALTWAERLGHPSPREAAAYAVAALREAWEETGILVAPGATGREIESGRRELLSGRRTLAELLRELDLRLGTSKLRYFAHWITPARFPRRFDTRFFLCDVDPDAACTLHGGELVEFGWFTPEAALRRAAGDGLRLMPPTLDTLRRLGRGEI